MKSKNGRKTSRTNTFLLLLAIAVSLTVVPANAIAKSLYVIADKGAPTDPIQPVHAYNIEADGTLTFQAEHLIRSSALGAVGMTIDTDAGYLFITYERSEDIVLIDAITMTGEGTVTAPGAIDLAGVVYDHDNGQLYTVDRRTSTLYAYNWEPEAKRLTHAPGSPFTLRKATAYGIALNEITDLLYVANGTNQVTVYSTSDWKLVDTITLDRVAISIAVGVVRGFLYTGGGFAGNKYLTQYHLATGTVKEVQVEPDAGVMGLGVDPATGYVYLTTGVDNAPGGDNLLVYDTRLNRIDIIPMIGSPTGLVVPGRDIGYNPLNLRKTLIRGGSGNINSDDIPFVGAGTTITYGILFDNFNDFIATDVLVSDQLPEEVTFVTADDDGVNGHYNPQTHTYEWLYPSLPPGTSTIIELTVEVDKDVETSTTITNIVTINSDQTGPTTTHLDVIVENNAVENNPLNLTKRISGVAEGQVAWVDVEEPITYTICFDNKDNDFTVTNVSVVDYLPDEVQFIGLDADTPSGKYDAAQHTYTWSFPSLAPGETICLDVNAQIKKDVDAGTTITNTVIVDNDETPTSMASVEAITYQNPLNLTKSISGAAEGQVPWVNVEEPITYTICFDNRDNDFPVTNVSVVDDLPDEVRFVGLGADTPPGKYDATEHTYTWLFPSLARGETICLDVNVQIKKNVNPGTTITNSVIVDSNETPTSMASAEAITYKNPLNLTKRISGIAEDQVAWIDADKSMTYTICFDNKNNDSPVTNVTVVDYLPDEVRFIDLGKGIQSGTYDATEHTYTWTFSSLEPGEAVCLEVNVKVDKDVDPGTIITNTVVANSTETPTSMASVEAITYQNPLNLTKRISGVAEGQIAWVDVDEPMTYTICFDNSNSDLPVTNVSVVDYLPDEVQFVGLGADTPSGKYDAAEHTYTWLFPSLAPGETICLNVNVQIEEDVDHGTTIINFVTAESDETPTSTASVEAITYQNPLNLTKSILGTPEGQTALVSADGPVTYIIQFDNNNDFTVTNISVFDVLPEEVSFVSAEGDLVSGKYDPVIHTCTWSFPSLEPGNAIRLELNARVNKDLSKDTIFTNSVTVESEETPPSTATADAIVADSLVIAQEMKVLPQIIRRSYATYDIQATIFFPAGYTKKDIAEVYPTLSPGEITAKHQIIYSSSTRTKVIALFDKNKLLDAVPDDYNGPITLKMVGTLTSGRLYTGHATVYITKYTGQ